MAYIGGTPAVQNFIKKYKASGYLVDPYSKDWLTSIEARRNIDTDFYCDIDDNQYSEYESKFGPEFLNHLLIVYVDESNSELIKDLQVIYEPFKYIFEERDSYSGYEKHRPDFIFINLAIRKILCIGLGRKNRLFEYDLDEYINNMSNSVDSTQLMATFRTDNPYYKKFTSLDHARFIFSTIRGLYEVGSGLFQNASTPGNPDEWPDEPNEDGIYLIEDDEYTAEEFQSIKDDYYEADELMHDGMNSVNLLFPEIDIGDLNTGDY